MALCESTLRSNIDELKINIALAHKLSKNPEKLRMLGEKLAEAEAELQQVIGL